MKHTKTQKVNNNHYQPSLYTYVNHHLS